MSEENNIKDITNPKSFKGGYLSIIIILFISLVILGWLYYQETQKSKQIIVKLNKTTDEKEEVNNQLTEMLNQYEEIKTDNKELSLKLDSQKVKIKEMIKNLKKVKSSNRWQIAQYKKELTTMREIMRSYIVQIDSLNTKNKELITENIKVKKQFNNQKQQNIELSKNNQKLSTVVSTAKVITSRNLTATPINRKSKPTKKIRKLDKIKVCFSLMENKVAEPGKRNVFIRIARPDETILANSEGQLFDYNGNKIVYTEKREIDYQNQDITTCVYWKKDQQLIPGTYYVDIFIDGKDVGNTTFTLK